MGLCPKQMVAVFDQMTLHAEEKVLRELFTKEDLKKIKREVRHHRAEQTNKETVLYYQNLLKEIGSHILNANPA